MQNYCKTIGALAAASALVAGTASAEVESEIHAGYNSAYIFRGINLGDELVEAGLDVATEYNGIGLSAGAWYGSWESPSGFPGFDADVDELDLYAEASKDLGFVTAAVGWIYYSFPQANGNAFFLPLDDAQEVYFSVSKTISGIDTSLAYFWDVETDNDGYTQLDLGKSFELNSCLTLNAGGTVGYLVEEGDLSHAQIKLSLDYALSDTATLTPYIAHSWALSEGGRVAGNGGTSTALYGGSGNELFAGASLAVSF